ncbi:YveK family protein [Brevibacterium casei]|uniref:Polysaccharide chain length determinant N-terminal domain-containing protein n=1 Tax=Brevibacterium casei S18 TaxID=1229781 RepID=K9AKT3_9MICO|nr:Wzz/FepE/Etk N-terminal domain-containing protein [Brevibacterium casei]EKU46691.1 hypothetical protein C272_10583 [Brevibacterium casei S18]
MNGQQILRIYIARRWWVIGSVIVGLIVGAGLALTLPPVHESRAQVIVSVADDADVTAGESAAYINDRIPTVLEVAKSADFASQIAELPGIDMGRSGVASALDFALVANTTVIEISAKDADPGQARQLANSAAETMSEPALTEQLGTESGLDIAVLQEAGAATSTVFPDPIRFIVFGGLAGLTIGLILAPLRNGLDRKLRDVNEIADATGAGFIGVHDSAPSRALSRSAANAGAATSTPLLLARLGVVGTDRGTRILTLCGIDGVGNELAADLVETAAANGMRCALVSADPAALHTAHYRELSRVRGVDVVDADGGRSRGVLGDRELSAAMPQPFDLYDLIVILSTDLVDRPDACVYLNRSDAVVIVTAEAPSRSKILTTRELLRVNGAAADGFIVVGRSDRGTGVRGRRRAGAETQTNSAEGSEPSAATAELNVVEATSSDVDQSARSEGEAYRLPARAGSIQNGDDSRNGGQS